MVTGDMEEEGKIGSLTGMESLLGLKKNFVSSDDGCTIL